jgi:hypothetical protein
MQLCPLPEGAGSGFRREGCHGEIFCATSAAGLFVALISSTAVAYGAYGSGRPASGLSRSTQVLARADVLPKCGRLVRFWIVPERSIGTC